ncbi:MAG: glycosyltransferase family 87 protein [Planctomycetota bacterium]
MSEFLIYYRRPDPTTWVYMSSFLTIGLFFIFRRFWSIRNLDIAILILLAPGLLMVNEGYKRHARLSAEISASLAEQEATDASAAGSMAAQANAVIPVLPDRLSRIQATNEMLSESQKVSLASANTIRRHGFIFLFCIEALLLLRMLLDPLMVRRPLLDPNLTTGGLNFIGISLFIFMMANVVASTPQIQQEQGPKLGPGYALVNMLPAIPTRPVPSVSGENVPQSIDDLTPPQQRRAIVAKVLAIAAQTAMLVGILLIGNRHFGNLRAGAGCAMLYLLMPYTAQMTGRVDHVVPAALLLWGVLFYRRPVMAGMFVGAAAGLVYYPLFLLPLWFSFYWQRGLRRFAIGVVAVLTILMSLLAFTGDQSFVEQLRQMFGLFRPTQDPRGVWELGWNPMWRLPVIVAFVILSFFLAVWPARKHLGILTSSSAAVMIAAQFWHGYGGGLYMAWFLPLVLLTVFRPNLQDRVALKVIDEPQQPRLRSPLEMDAA